MSGIRVSLYRALLYIECEYEGLIYETALYSKVWYIQTWSVSLNRDDAADDEDFPANFYYKENEEHDSQAVANSPSPLAYRSH